MTRNKTSPVFELTHDSVAEQKHLNLLQENLDFQLERYRDAPRTSSKAIAFDKYMHIFHQLHSQITLLTDFRYPVAKPTLPRLNRHGRIKPSPSDHYDTSNDEYLDDIQNYIDEKEKYHRELAELDDNLSQQSTMLQDNILPLISELLQAPMFANMIYSRLKHGNPLTVAQESAKKIEADCDDIRQKITQLNEDFHVRWGDHIGKYENIIQSDHKKLAQMKKAKAEHDLLLSLLKHIRDYPDEALHQALDRFHDNPNYDTLFSLCEQAVRCQYEAIISESPNKNQMAEVIIILRQLYPKVATQLSQFEKESLTQATNAEILSAMLKRIKTHTGTMIAQNEQASQRIKLALEKYQALMAKRDKMNLLLQSSDIENINQTLKQWKEKIVKLENVCKTKEISINAMQAFLQSQSGEHLYRVIQICRHSDTENMKEISRYLSDLYPNALQQLEREQETQLSTHTLEKLKQEYDKALEDLDASQKERANQRSVTEKLTSGVTAAITSIYSSKKDAAKTEEHAVLQTLSDFMDHPTWTHYLRYQEAKHVYQNTKDPNLRILEIIAHAEQDIMAFLQQYPPTTIRQTQEYFPNETPIDHIGHIILSYRDVSLRNAFHEFQANTNEETAFALCEQIARYTHEKNSSDPQLSSVISTLQRLFPNISSMLEHSESEMQSHIVTEIDTFAFLNHRVQALAEENQNIVAEAQACRAQFHVLEEKHNRMISTLSSEKYNVALEELENKLQKLKPTFRENKALIALLSDFLQSKSQESLQRLRTHCSEQHPDILKALNAYAPETSTSHTRTSMFQSPQKAANRKKMDALIKELYQLRNMYSIVAMDHNASSEQKHAAIYEISAMLSYFIALSGEHQETPITSEYARLLREISEFILQVQEHPEQRQLNLEIEDVRQVEEMNHSIQTLADARKENKIALRRAQYQRKSLEETLETQLGYREIKKTQRQLDDNNEHMMVLLLKRDDLEAQIKSKSGEFGGKSHREIKDLIDDMRTTEIELEKAQELNQALQNQIMAEESAETREQIQYQIDDNNEQIRILLSKHEKLETQIKDIEELTQELEDLKEDLELNVSDIQRAEHQNKVLQERTMSEDDQNTESTEQQVTKIVTEDLITNTRRQIEDNAAHIRKLQLEGENLDTKISQKTAACDEIESKSPTTTTITPEQQLDEARFIQMQQMMSQQLDAQHPMRLAVQFIIELYRSTPEYIAINTEPAKQKLREELSMAIDKIKEQRADPAKRRPHNQYHKWSEVNAIQFLIKSYIEALDLYPSEQNAEERAVLNALEKQLVPVQQVLKYDKDRHSKLPALFAELDRTLEPLGEHPMKDVIHAYVVMLKETDEYHDFEGPGLGK
ncbi:MAG: hypothetical protein NXI01_08215 [Gammaproteobacteria bacterium]|nr:hypothetical protein [Gammaproteobacteria bacterium]